MDRVSDMAGDFNPGDFNLGDIQKYVEGIEFPVSKDNLLSAAESNGAPSALIDKIRGSDMSQFSGVEDVISSVKSF